MMQKALRRRATASYDCAMRPEQPKYWFPAKRYGWGWGVPASWQGWLVLLAFLALTIAGIFLVPPGAHPVWFAGYIALLTTALMIVCLLKGEPPRWRWGGDDRS